MYLNVLSFFGISIEKSGFKPSTVTKLLALNTDITRTAKIKGTAVVKLAPKRDCNMRSAWVSLRRRGRTKYVKSFWLKRKAPTKHCSSYIQVCVLPSMKWSPANAMSNNRKFVGNNRWAMITTAIMAAKTPYNTFLVFSSMPSGSVD